MKSGGGLKRRLRVRRHRSGLAAIVAVLALTVLVVTLTGSEPARAQEETTTTLTLNLRLGTSLTLPLRLNDEPVRMVRASETVVVDVSATSPTTFWLDPAARLEPQGASCDIAGFTTQLNNGVLRVDLPASGGEPITCSVQIAYDIGGSVKVFGTVQGFDPGNVSFPALQVSNDQQFGSVRSSGQSTLRLPSGTRNLYLQVPPEWIILDLTCEGDSVTGSASGVLPDGSIGNIGAEIVAGSESSCLANFRLVEQPTNTMTFGDANCDGKRDIVDALVIVQYEVSIRSDSGGCPLTDLASQLDLSNADIDHSGQVDIVDALMVARCVASVAGSWCGPERAWTIAREDLLPDARQIEDLGDGSILVSDDQQIVRIDSEGTKSTFAEGLQATAMHLSDDGELWVGDISSAHLRVFDTAGTELRSISIGVNDGDIADFSCPMSIAVDSGEVFVLDGFRDRVRVFDLDGAFLREWGSTGSGPGEFDLNCWTGTLVVHGNEIHVSDCTNRRVQVLGRDGTYVREWVVLLGEADPFQAGDTFCPAEMDVDASGTFYVSDYSSTLVAVSSTTGEVIETVWSAFDEFEYGTGAQFSERHDLHVNDAGTKLWVTAEPPFVVPSPDFQLAAAAVDLDERIVTFERVNPAD